MAREKLLFSLFNLLYTRLAWAYDVVAWVVSAGQWYNWVESALPFIEDGPVLEVGCGRGHLLEPITDLGYSVVGVDYTMQMAQYAKQVSQKPVIRGNGSMLPFPNGHFGTLITTFPAPYVLDAHTQREFARVVRSGGLWLWVDAPLFEPTAITALARLITRAAYGTPEQSYGLRYQEAERSGGLWQVHVKRVMIGYTSVALRIASRCNVWEEFTS